MTEKPSRHPYKEVIQQAKQKMANAERELINSIADMVTFTQTTIAQQKLQQLREKILRKHGRGMTPEQNEEWLRRYEAFEQKLKSEPALTAEEWQKKYSHVPF